jgi:hypothetical protein
MSIFTLNSGRPTPDPVSGLFVDQGLRLINTYSPFVAATCEKWQKEMRVLQIGDLLLVYVAHRLPNKDGGVVRAVVVSDDPYEDTHTADDRSVEPATCVPVITVARSLRPVRLGNISPQPKTRPGGVLCPTSLESWQAYVRAHAVRLLGAEGLRS